ncbi:MAG: 4-hydroxythreonine-4-phosphate dehydrogenase PdxA [Desulfofustis sp.]|nr:4-hydroxythreonine-4-phosphate dehydrogenase PdxA [Desulfofustis sp.]
MSRQAEINRPIGITMGCPASIGPELIVKFHLDNMDTQVPVIVIGDRNVLKKISDLLSLSVDIRDWYPGKELAAGCLNVLNVSSLSTESFSFGSPTHETSVAMVSYVEKAIALCLGKDIRALVTCPISKSSLNQAGYDFPGHTELLARRTSSDDVAMMLAGDTLRIVPATIHCSLSEVVKNLNSKGLVRQILLTEQALRTDFNLDQVRIAVAGLNPHAGENGLFGNEEQIIIEPAVEEARRYCHPHSKISGPYPPDTVFYKAKTGLYDAVIAMYHDQGLIPFKLLHFDDGVNITLGLPIVRTSVDHGTAYDIAGKGSAATNSLKAAVRFADFMAANRLRIS